MSSDQSLALVPPLLGDGHGHYRVQLVGNSGSGKSTLGKELSAILGVPYISLDTLFWLPNWGKTPTEEFREKVRAALAQDDRGWIVDGNFDKRLGSIVPDAATDVIWLDTPFALYFPRLCLRTLMRLLRLTPSCSPDCPESIREVFFSRNSIVWWCITHHRVVQKRERARLLEDGVQVGGKRRRIGGWGRELAEWKASVAAMVQAEVQTNSIDE